MIRLEEDQVEWWNQFLLHFPEAHILQTSQWAEAKRQTAGALYYLDGGLPVAMGLP